MDKIASGAQAQWFGGWSGNIQNAVNAYVTTVTNAGALPVIVAYNIPQRDCGGFSEGGVNSYRQWIQAFSNGIGSRRAVVILEPDALPGMDCLSNMDRTRRMQLLNQAVGILKGKPNTTVYIDAGHPRWQSAQEMATRLTNAGVAQANGFSLNVSNYVNNAENISYGTQISNLIGGKHFVIDTGRNGQGTNGEWCNALGRGLGLRSTASTGNPIVDAFFWVKRPGESDGPCNGGPAPGTWWAEYALGLAQRSNW